MKMAVSHKGAISFGLVYIPVALYTATQDNDIHFNQLHKEDNSRIRYKKTCSHCGKEVAAGDIIKGFEYDKDKYVVVTDEDLEMIKTEKDKTIQILHFADLDTINPIYYEKSYHTVPETGGEKAFELLRTAMKDENRVAIAKTVMGNKETLLAIIPAQDNLLISTMFFEDDIKELPKSFVKPALNEGELDMAKTLIRSMAKPFEPDLYKDEYQGRLRDLIQQKISGREIVAAKEEAPSNVIDLMEALKRSIEQNQGAGASQAAAGQNQNTAAGQNQGAVAVGQNWTPAIKSPPGA
jgi:DNA end-binding protein Ku